MLRVFFRFHIKSSLVHSVQRCCLVFGVVQVLHGLLLVRDEVDAAESETAFQLLLHLLEVDELAWLLVPEELLLLLPVIVDG